MITLRKRFPVYLIFSLFSLILTRIDAYSQNKDEFHFMKISCNTLNYYTTTYGIDSIKRIIIQFVNVRNTNSEHHFFMKGWVLLNNLTLIDTPNLIDIDNTIAPKETIIPPYFFANLELRKADIENLIASAGGQKWDYIGLEPLTDGYNYLIIRASLYSSGKVVSTTIIGTAKDFNPSPPYKPQG